MTQITASMRADMHARRLRGQKDADIAAAHGVKAMAVYQSLRRYYGLDIYKFATVEERYAAPVAAYAEPTATEPIAANDNVPGRVRKMSPHNGGCSTLSGMMPVTLARVPTVDGPEQMQVAA